MHDRGGGFANAPLGHAWRSTVHLDRPAHYTDGQLVLGDEVAMPDAADYGAEAGYQRGRWWVPVGLAAQRTLGGGDIRRQDMPVVSNRVNFTKVNMSEVRAARTFALAQRRDARRGRRVPGDQVPLPLLQSAPDEDGSVDQDGDRPAERPRVPVGPLHVLRRGGDEAGISRLYGGIHYRSDIDNGKAHGVNVGAEVVRFAQSDGAR